MGEACCVVKRAIQHESTLHTLHHQTPAQRMLHISTPPAPCCWPPAEIEICKRPDGSDWELGSGGFGKVCSAAVSVFVVVMTSRLDCPCGGCESGLSRTSALLGASVVICPPVAAHSHAGVQGAAPRGAAGGGQGAGGECGKP